MIGIAIGVLIVALAIGLGHAANHVEQKLTGEYND